MIDKKLHLILNGENRPRRRWGRGSLERVYDRFI